MSDRMTVFLKGTIETLTPFANSPAGAADPRSKARLLPRIPVNLGGRWEQLPVIQSSTIRGKLRRAAAQLLLDKFEALDLKPSFEDWLLWTVGGVKGSDRDSSISIKERQEIIEASPLLAVFGAGSSKAGFVTSRFHIDPAIPEQGVETSVIEGARTAENRKPELVQILDPEEIERVDLYTAANRARSDIRTQIRSLDSDIKKSRRAKDTEAVERLTKEKEELEQTEKDAEEAQRKFGSDVTIGMPLAGYEVIGAGAVLPHRMVIKNASAEQIGFVFSTLEEFAFDPRVGAHTATGCGLIGGQYNVSVRRTRRGDIEDIGSVSWDDIHGLKVEGDEINSWIDIWENLEINPENIKA